MCPVMLVVFYGWHKASRRKYRTTNNTMNFVRAQLVRDVWPMNVPLKRVGGRKGRNAKFAEPAFDSGS